MTPGPWGLEGIAFPTAMVAVTVRAARDDELDQVAALIDAAWREYDERVRGSEERMASYRGYREHMLDVRSRLDEAELLVAERDGTIVGTVTYYPSVDGVSTGEGWPPGWASIRLLGVHPEARGAGIGRLLTEECIRRARAEGAPTVGLHTTALMSIARAMYERMGFTRLPAHDFVIDDDFIVEAFRLDL